MLQIQLQLQPEATKLLKLAWKKDSEEERYRDSNHQNKINSILNRNYFILGFKFYINRKNTLSVKRRAQKNKRI